MSKADGKCNRCKGTGFRDCARAHYGVPGLCFDCDGSGKYEDQAAAKAARKLVKTTEDRRRAVVQPVYDLLWETRREAEQRGVRASYDQRRWMAKAGVFSTQTFADAFQLTKREGWEVLCCAYPKVGIYYDEATNAVAGWAVEYNA